MNVADRCLLIHMDAITHAAPVRRKRRYRIAPTLAFLAAALLMLALAAWR